MFRKKEIERTLEDIRKEKEELIKLLEEIKKEKNDFLKMQEAMYCSFTDDCIDISNVYVMFCDGIYSLVKLEVQDIVGDTPFQKKVAGIKSTLIDIFTEQVIYTKSSIEPLNSTETISELNELKRVYITPICQKNRKLLLYADKNVPKYVLQKYYYKLNNIDLTELDIEKELIK